MSSSKYGYFNNPIRLSPTKFSFWLSKKENKEKIIKYLLKHGGYTGKEWIKKNKKDLLSSKRNFKELYIPRAIFNSWMEEKLILLISSMKKTSKEFLIKFNIFFLKGEVVGINYKKNIHK